MTLSMTPLESLTINTIRTLSMEGVQQAKSGHPGTAMALAPVMYLLYNERMKYDPLAPQWLGRDRFVLSIGHASMLIYSTLHVAGVCEEGGNVPAVSLDDIKNFRQLGSKCAGHPEYGHVAGVETTTGPLGAGLATSVGMAIADRWLAGRYNKSDFSLFKANVYALCGDGDMMEGISSEAASLAGHLKLDNLCWIYDDNKITIEGSTDLAFSENVHLRFESYGWNVIKVDDVNDLAQLRKAFDAFEASDRPTLIIVQTVIAYGAPTKAGTEEAHGAPLGEEELRGAKQFYGLNPDQSFVVDESFYDCFRTGIAKRGATLHQNWKRLFDTYRTNWPALADELDGIVQGHLPNNWDNALAEFPADEKGMATRASSGKVLNQVALGIPWFLGGSADLAPSNCTELKFPEAGEFSATSTGRNFHFGIRENAMAAAVNGMVLSGLRAYCATFFVFADYMRPMIRLAALMNIPTMFIFTHDSIGVGEDGPTHQPIEHLAALRAIPNLAVFRPADANEVAEVYRTALELKTMPSAIVLTRQNLPTIDRTKFASAKGATQGGYLLASCEGKPQLILIGTGSEVALCLAAYIELTARGIKTQVVSMPSWEIFERQSSEYREQVLDKSAIRIAVELGVEQGWHKYIGDQGKFLGMNHFGLSGPAGTLMKHFRFTVENLVHLAESALLEFRVES